MVTPIYTSKVFYWNCWCKFFLFHHSLLLFTIMVDKLELRNDFFSTWFPRVPPLKRWFSFSKKKFFFLKIPKQQTASLISTLNTGETKKIKLTNYFILRMRVFIQNFTNIEKGVKFRGKKFTYPNYCFKVQFPSLDSSQTLSALTRTSFWLKKDFGLVNT